MPTFEVDNAPIILLASMVMLASWLEGGPEHQKLAPVVYDEVNRIRMVWKIEPTQNSFTK